MKQRQINLIAVCVGILVILVLLGGSVAFNYYLEGKKIIKTSSKEDTKNNNLEQKTPESLKTYDTSSFQSIKLEEYLDIFKNEETTFLYFGRSTCSACKYYVPILNDVQKKYGFKVYYIDSNSVDYDSELFSQFLNLDEQIKNNFGGVPLSIIAQNNKVLKINIGALNNEQLIKFLKEANMIGDIND